MIETIRDTLTECEGRQNDLNYLRALVIFLKTERSQREMYRSDRTQESTRE